MPASIQNLYTQSRSLQAYTQALQVTGKNIASSADPNYARQQVTMQSALPGIVDYVHGAAVDAGIKDTRDQLIEAQIWRERSDLGFQNEQLGYLEQLELALFSGSNEPLTPAPESGEALSDGLVPRIEDFFSAWKAFSAGTQDDSAKSSLLQAAETLLDRFHQDAESIEGLKRTLSDGIASSVETINSLLGQIGLLQEQIGWMPTETTSAKMDMLSARDAKLSELSEYISFTWTPNNSAPLESTLSVRMADGTSVDLLTGSQVNDTFSWNEGALTLAQNGGQPSADRGVLGGQFQVLTKDLVDLENHWNTLASEMVSQVNSRYNPPPGTRDNFFDPASGMAGSIRLEVTNPVNLRAGSGASGNDIAASIEKLAETDLSANPAIAGTFFNDLLNQQNKLARRIYHGRNEIAAQEKVVSFLEQEKSSRSGVDLDAEVTNLLQFQRSFQATSRVLRALDESLQTFLSDIA